MRFSICNVFSWFLFWICVGWVIACNSTGADSEELVEEYTIVGTWKINVNKPEAIWIGRQSKNKQSTSIQANGDTLYYDRPDGQNLTIRRNGFDPDLPPDFVYPDTSFVVQYIDSSLGTTTYPDISIADATVKTPFKNDSTHVGTDWGFSEDYIIITSQNPFNCDSTYSFTNEIFEFQLSHEGNITRTYQANVYGLSDAAFEILCN